MELVIGLSSLVRSHIGELGGLVRSRLEQTPDKELAKMDISTGSPPPLAVSRASVNLLAAAVGGPIIRQHPDGSAFV